MCGRFLNARYVSHITNIGKASAMMRVFFISDGAVVTSLALAHPPRSQSSQVRAVFAACAVVILGGWIDASRAVGYVDWPLLVLIGSALGLSKAIVNSGLARYAADAVRESGISRSASIYVLFAFTMVSLEKNEHCVRYRLEIVLSS